MLFTYMGVWRWDKFKCTPFCTCHWMQQLIFGHLFHYAFRILNRTLLEHSMPCHQKLTNTKFIKTEYMERRTADKQCFNSHKISHFLGFDLQTYKSHFEQDHFMNSQFSTCISLFILLSSPATFKTKPSAIWPWTASICPQHFLMKEKRERKKSKK